MSYGHIRKQRRRLPPSLRYSETQMHGDSMYVGTVSRPGQPDEDWHFRPYSRQNVEALRRDAFACLVIARRRDLTKLWTASLAKWTSVKSVGQLSLTRDLSTHVKVKYVSRRHGQKHFESGSARLNDLLEDVDRGQLAAAVVTDISLPLDHAAIEAALADLAANTQGDSGDSDSSLEARNREALLQAQRQMLARVQCLTSEGLATKLQSTAVNASQLGNDLRNSGKIFGVRYGRAWHYPEFQFEPAGKPFPEMRDVLAASIGDERGWDRLQWFLEANEALSGRTPLEVWETGHRELVVEAARRTKWQGRN